MEQYVLTGGRDGELRKIAEEMMRGGIDEQRERKEDGCKGRLGVERH